MKKKSGEQHLHGIINYMGLQIPLPISSFVPNCRRTQIIS